MLSLFIYGIPLDEFFDNESSIIYFLERTSKITFHSYYNEPLFKILIKHPYNFLHLPIHPWSGNFKEKYWQKRFSGFPDLRSWMSLKCYLFKILLFSFVFFFFFDFFCVFDIFQDIKYQRKIFSVLNKRTIKR